jgi:branched-chain amino acid transport system substrate-binding protein
MEDHPDHSKESLSRRRFVQGVGLAGGVVAASGALGTTLAMLGRAFAAGAPPQIVVGQLVPFTGSAAEFGVFYRDAADLAIKQINTAAKAVFGGPIIGKHIVQDSETLPTPAIAAARQIVDADGAAALICGWSSGVTVAVATSVTIPSGVLQVANGATSPLISVLPANQTAHLLFRTSPSDLLQGVVAAQLVSGEVLPDYKFSRVATIYINNPYGQGLSNAFTKDFEHRGGKVLVQVPHPEKVQPTYKSELQAALKDKPELLMVISYPAHTAVICKESRDIFDFTNWEFTDGNQSLDVLKAVGGATLNGKLGTAPQADPNAPAYKAFAERFMKDYHHDHIPPFTADTYDAAAVIGLAMAKTVADGYTDPRKITGQVLAERLPVIADPPGEQIPGGSEADMQKALALLKKGKKINYEGAGGPVDFDKHGDVKTPIGVWKFTETGIEIVKVVPAEKIASM